MQSFPLCIDEAKKELRENARPEIKAFPDNIDSYDTIFVGYPNWWGTLPMCMFTLLEKCDLKSIFFVALDIIYAEPKRKSHITE